MIKALNPETQKQAEFLTSELVKLLLEEARKNGDPERSHIRIRIARLVTDILENEGVI